MARGINDLQVKYVDGDGGCSTSPSRSTPSTPWDRMVRQVNVTLSSRVAGMNIAGFTGQDESRRRPDPPGSAHGPGRAPSRPAGPAGRAAAPTSGSESKESQQAMTETQRRNEADGQA